MLITIIHEHAIAYSFFRVKVIFKFLRGELELVSVEEYTLAFILRATDEKNKLNSLDISWRSSTSCPSMMNDALMVFFSYPSAH